MEKELLDLTVPQKSIWLTEQYYANTNINNICATVIASEKLNFDVLSQAINLVIQNSDNFNSHFVEKNGELKQYFEKIDYQKFEIIELNSKEDISNLEQNLLSKVFNIKENLFEIKLFKIKNSDTCGCLINVHHIIADAYSIGLLCQNVMNNYVALLKNESIEFNPNFSYEQYINSEKEYINSKKFEADKQYWEEKFSTMPNIVSIPSRKTTSNINKLEANRYTYILEKEKVEKIANFCSENKLSFFNIFFAVLGIYVKRINNTNNFIIGTPILNRTNFSEKNTMGMFINISPFKISVDENDTLLNFLNSIVTESMGLLRHQKYSYQYILEDLRKQNPSIPNLYNIILSYQITKTTSDSNINYSTRWAFNGSLSNDIEMHIYDTNAKNILEISYDYKTCKYSKNDIQKMNSRLMYILEQVITHIDQKVKDIQIVTPDEQKELLQKFNKTYLKYDPNLSIIESFEKQVEKTPNAIALTFEGKKYSYLKLNALANVLAHTLREHNIRNNSIVAILMNRSPEIIVSILAILKAGGAYLPIDPDYPSNRITDIFEESNVDLVLFKNSNLEILNNYNHLEINIENFKLTKENTKNLCNISQKNDLSYIIFTSGSTGKPKGVTLTNQNFSNFLASMKNKIEYLNFEKKLSIISITTISFDIFGFESIISLCCGLHLYLTNYFEQKQTSKLEKYIKDNHIDIIQTTPSIMYHHIKNQKDPKSFSNLKYFILAGEPLTENLIQEIFKANPNAVVYNGYGPSETTIFSTITKISDSKNIMIGKPIDNTQIYILDENQKLLPPGTIGELYIGGDGVGAGYLNQPELTKKSFIKNPYGEGLIYQTGDIGYWQKDGTIICKGRKDTQIKLHGLRIELSEIEHQINEFLKNKYRTCVILQDTEESPVLNCFIESRNASLNLNNLKQYLLLSLPNYMIPHHFTILKKFPQTANGKINKRELKTIIPKNQASKIQKPSNDIEQAIFDIISNYVNVDNVGVTDDFFSIGLDSLTIINVVIEINNKFNTNLSVGDIYKKLNVQEFAKYLAEMPSNKEYTFYDIYKKLNHYPLSSAQKRIFYASSVSDDNLGVYNIFGGIEFKEKLNFEKIQNIFNILINRHEAFRTYFIIDNGEVYQNIDKTQILNIEQKFIFQKNLNKEFDLFNENIDLSKAPLLKVKVLYTRNKTIILINMHHIISDGMSMRILISEFCDLYNNKVVPKKKFTYRDYINYEQYFSGSDKYEKNKEFWMNEFSGELPSLTLPTIQTRPASFTFKGNKISYTLNKRISQKIYDISKKLNITPYMFLLSIYYILLYKYSGQTDIIVGTPSANRNISEFSDIIGMFVNTIAIRKNIDTQKSFVEFLTEIKEKCLACFEHENYPFDQIVHDLNIPRDTSRNPLFDTMFSFQNKILDKITLHNSPIKYIIPESKIAKFDIIFEVIPQEENMIFNIEYCTDLFNEDFIMSFLKHYINILNTVIKNPEQTINNINILSLKEKRELKKFNLTDLDTPKKLTLIDKFETIVKKFPSNIAVEYNNSRISYRKLDTLSNYLAKELINNNIQKGDVVGVCLNKSLELIVSIWAILKVGAVYMPMYSNYPKDRLEYMIQNSNAKLLITNLGLEKNISLPVNKFIFNNINELHNNYLITNFNKINSSDIAYLIYTSGSTGKPKGVQIKHSNLINFIYAFNKYYKNKISEKDNFLSSTNISFDVSIWEIFLPLLNGAKLVLYNEEIISDIVNYSNYIISNKITALYIPPNILNDVYMLLEKQNVLIEKLLVGVEAIKKSTLNNYYNLNPNMIIVNGYGPTETTICATALNYKKDTTDDNAVSIGKPLYNNNIYIVDSDMNLVPKGVLGEIYVAGSGVGAGYLNNSEENKKRFIPNQFDKSSKFIYKTGDIATWNNDGTINFIGRKDNQIKLSGYRIELGEIESKINQFPYIKKTLTIVKDIENRKTLLSYIIADKKIVISDLMAYLKKSLPIYMIPKFIIQLDAFPLTPNGKIDKKALEIPKIESEFNYEGPTNDVEELLCDIWKKIFNLEKISITSNFFELGGDSLTAIKFQTEVLKYGLNMNYSNIFTHPTIKELANNNYLKETVYKIDMNYNYQKFNKILNKNTIENIKKAYKKKTPKKLLLFGATGFLGAHILDAFLSSTETKVYCLIRKRGTEDTETRLKKVLNYYFGEKYLNYFGKRIFVINGDITKSKLGMSKENYTKLSNTITHVINSAAFVKHFGNYNKFKSINIDGTKNIIAFCKNANKKLYHISTISVSGMDQPKNNSVEKIFSEKDFFINQDLNNVYVYTKFEAEKAILEEINHGLNACIIRMGNILNRSSDGKFQINFSENAFINRIKSILNLQAIPKEMLNHSLEISPVDKTAELIKQIVCTENDFTVFHAYNPNIINIETLLKYITSLGYSVKTVSAEKFADTIDKFLNDSNKKQEIFGLIQFLNNNKQIEFNYHTQPTQDFTLEFLKRINFTWPILDFDYIKVFLKFFNDIDYIKKPEVKNKC